MIRSLFTRDLLAVVLAVLGAGLLVAGVWLMYLPAGVVLAGVCCVAAAYLIRYLEVQSETS